MRPRAGPRPAPHTAHPADTAVRRIRPDVPTHVPVTP
ncbi:hypothetical protein M2168_000810 [Streptomyces sp. CZ24]|nr:hypothetical protein [Streptomyces sp. CZ24]